MKIGFNKAHAGASAATAAVYTSDIVIRIINVHDAGFLDDVTTIAVRGLVIFCITWIATALVPAGHTP